MVVALQLAGKVFSNRTGTPVGEVLRTGISAITGLLGIVIGP
jgi:hypothetical protein